MLIYTMAAEGEGGGTGDHFLFFPFLFFFNIAFFAAFTIHSCSLFHLLVEEGAGPDDDLFE